MQLKKITSILLAGAMALSMAACTSSATPAKEASSAASDMSAEPSAGASMTAVDAEMAVDGAIGLSLSTLNNPFFVTLSEGAEEAAKELGLNLITVDAGDDAAKQASDIEDLISKNISVLIVNPVDSDAVATVVQEAIDKGIKVISVDRSVNGAEVDCAIASDNVAGAKLAAEYLVEKAGEGAKTVELEGVPGASATIDRGEGFHGIADKKLDVLASQTANFNRSEGMTVMENMLQSHPDIQAVFCHNDEMALGAIEALGDKSGIIIAAFDATDDGVQAVKDGKLAATVAQDPALMGKTAVENASKLIKGESIEAVIPVEVKLVTADNVGEYIKK